MDQLPNSHYYEYNEFRQPEWMIEHALPSPPDVFGLERRDDWKSSWNVGEPSSGRFWRACYN